MCVQRVDADESRVEFVGRVDDAGRHAGGEATASGGGLPGEPEVCCLRGSVGTNTKLS